MKAITCVIIAILAMIALTCSAMSGSATSAKDTAHPLDGGSVAQSAAVSPGACRKLSNGSGVSVSGQVVTAVFPNRVYLEAPDRSAGIGLETTTQLEVGDEVSASGIVTTENGERVIVANTCDITAYKKTVPKPLGMRTKCITGSGINPDGPDNGGLLIRIWGTVTYRGSGSSSAYVDDGSQLNDGNSLGRDGAAVIGVRVILPAQVPALSQGDYVIVTGISACEMVGDHLARAVRVSSLDDLQIVQDVPGPPFTPLKFAIIMSPTAAYGGWPTYSAITNQLNKLAITYEEAHCDSSGNVQPGPASAGRTDAGYENTLDGAIAVYYNVSDSTEIQAALNKAHRFKMLGWGYSSMQKTSRCNTGMSSIYDDRTSLASSVEQQAYTQISGSEAKSITGWFGIWHKADGVTPITKLLYLKFAGTQYHVAWEVNATGNMFAGIKQFSAGSVNLANVVIGLYVQRLGKLSQTYTFPMYINIDDANVGLSASCIDNVAAALRATGGIVPAGWGSNALIAGGVNPASPVPAANPFAVHPNHPETALSWKNALDVIPQILHDHETLPGLKTPVLQQTWSPDQIGVVLGARLIEAKGWAGFDLGFSIGSYVFVAWAKISDNGLIALARMGVRNVRQTVDETGHTRSGVSSLFDSANGVTYKMRNIQTCSSGNGEWRETWGSRFMTSVRYAGFAVDDTTVGRVFYLHGPQFATGNAGGIRRNTSNPMQPGDAVIVNGVEYSWVASGATGNQLNVSGDITTDMSNLASKLSAALSGTATVTLLNDNDPDYPVSANNSNVEIVPTNPSATITVDCNETAGRKVAPISCTPRDVALEIITSNYINLSTLAPMYRIANYGDWQAW